MHDDGVVDLLWYYYSYVSQEAIIRSVQFSSPSLVFFQQTSSSSASFFCTLLRRGFGESSVLVRNNPFSFQLGSTYLCKSMSCYALYVTSTCMFPFSLLYIYKICANKIRLLYRLISFQSLFWICSIHVIFHELCGFLFL